MRLYRCASPLSQFDFFSLPMIELCDIFSLDSPAKQQVLFVRQTFNLSSFRAISDPAIFYRSRSDSLKFSVSLSAWRVAEVCSDNFQIKIVCFERLIESLDSVFCNARQNHIIGRHIYISTRTEQARDARRLHCFYELLF